MRTSKRMTRALQAFLGLLLILGLQGLTAGPARAANPAHLRDVVYADGVVTLQFTEPTSYKTTFWRSARRFAIDVDASGVDLSLSQLLVNSSRLKAVRWNQWKQDEVRIVLDLAGAARPVVLASAPTNVIDIRVAPSGSSAAAARPADPASPVAPVAPAPQPAAPQPPSPRPATRTSQPAPAHIGEITVERDGDGRPERIVVQTDSPVSPDATWWNNHLAIDMPEAERSRERIVPINDAVLLRARTGTFEGHGRVVLDFTQRVGYKLSTLDGGLGFALDFTLPAPGAPAASSDDGNVFSGEPSPDGIKGRLIVLDPGHGDFDKGAHSQWAVEKAVNLDIALRLRTVLESLGARVVMTRSDDTFIPLKQRPALAMKLNADAFVSIHHNSSARPTNTGTEVYYRRNDAESRRLAMDLYAAHRAQTGLRGRGVKPDSNAPQGGLAVLHYNTVPCALVEVAFLNHPDEGPKVADPNWRQQVAEGLAKGLERFFSGD